MQNLIMYGFTEILVCLKSTKFKTCIAQAVCRQGFFNEIGFGITWNFSFSHRKGHGHEIRIACKWYD